MRRPKFQIHGTIFENRLAKKMEIQIYPQQLGYNGGRSRLDLQISMDYINDIVAQCNQGTIEKPESIFNRSCTNTDTFDESF